jgi:hypothetical protein
LRSLPVLLAIAIAGCFTSATDVLQTPSRSWSKRDCLTVMVSSMRHNLSDNESNVQAIVTPYIPKVVEAIARMQQLDDSTDDETTRNNLDLLLKSGAGLFIDWENQGRLANARGNYYRHPRELDSLLFMVMLKNRSWPCNVPLQTVQVSPGVYGMRPIAGLADWPCTTPEIHDLDRKIFLINAAGDTLRPKFIWGRNNEVLTMEEHVFVMFDFSKDRERPFLKEGDGVTMVLSGFDRPMKFLFPLDILGQPPLNSFAFPLR